MQLNQHVQRAALAFCTALMVTAFTAPVVKAEGEPANKSDAQQAPAPKKKVSQPKPKPAPAEGQAANTGKTFGSWVVSCDEKLPKPQGCVAQFQAIDTKRKVAILTWSLGYNKSGALLSEVVSPMDVMIEPGVAVAMGADAATTAKYVSCAAAGCLSRQPVDQAMLAALKADSPFTFTIVSTAGKSITFNVKISKTPEALAVLGQ